MNDLQRHEPRLSKFQGFKMERVARGDVKNAVYNPRVMPKGNAKALRDELRANLLVEPLVWNKRTGNLVGGHQRLEQLDALEGGPDYSLDFAVIDVDERKEKAINVALNNRKLQGDYDFARLEQLMTEDGFDFAAAGVDMMTATTWFGETSPALDLFAISKAPPAVQQAVGELAAVNEQERPNKRKKKAEETPDERIERMRREKKEYREMATERDDTEYYAVAVFPDRAKRERFMEALGLDKNERYINGADLAALLDIDLDAPADSE